MPQTAEWIKRTMHAGEAGPEDERLTKLAQGCMLEEHEAAGCAAYSGHILPRPTA